MIEEPASSDCEEDLIVGVVDDVVGADGRERLSTHAEGASLELDDVFLEDDVAAGGNSTAETNLVKTVSDVALNFVDSLTQLFGNGLTYDDIPMQVEL